jgi:hypothetical protein
MAVGVDLNWPATEGNEDEDCLLDLNQAPLGDEEDECYHHRQRSPIQTQTSMDLEVPHWTPQCAGDDPTKSHGDVSVGKRVRM